MEVYIERRRGKKFDYPLPQLEPILTDTYGVLVYQEQVMLAARAVAGYTPGEADKLRKAIGKKDETLLKAEGEKFIKKAVDARDAEEEGRGALGADPPVRPLRLQQVALGGLRAPRLPDGLDEGPLPGRVHGRDAHRQLREVGRGRQVRQQLPGDEDRRSSRPT